MVSQELVETIFLIVRSNLIKLSRTLPIASVDSHEHPGTQGPKLSLLRCSDPSSCEKFLGMHLYAHASHGETKPEKSKLLAYSVFHSRLQSMKFNFRVCFCCIRYPQGFFVTHWLRADTRDKGPVTPVLIVVGIKKEKEKNSQKGKKKRERKGFP